MFWNQELKTLQSQSLLRTLKKLPKGVINFCSNDYLGLSHHPKVIRGAIQATKKYGAGSGAARLVSGNNPLMEELEQRLAQWKKTESVLLFNSGYHANIGVIPALADENTIIFSDELNHASIIDGCRLSRAKVQVYRHNDMDDLEELLRRGGVSPPANNVILGRGNPAPTKIIITESVFSMEGDLAPLDDLKNLAEKYGALLYVDEAHAVGVFGEKGCGRVWDISDNIITMGTLGKAFGSYGAFVAGSEPVKKYLINKARSFIFATALPPAALGASLAALKIIQSREGEKLREELWSSIDLVNRELALDQGDSPIFSIRIGDSKKTMGISEKLLRNKIYIQGIRPPTVPVGTSRLRLTLSASHSVNDLGKLISILRNQM